ncbi:hypothetical protein FXV83_24835 [Bradyrhizobium hipponense]|uniref:Uncharacterized protein n=1 Tax=Bradyrhizobium hipponense TaxID=2605638 RepID=A0A5S4YIL2_9BRAD|nr:hypothetical protein [Bradyrhizobium hipponense]TYO63938.1 hypothetical protein FXV83_24835 [Bradyrhizobium hipponense]
MHAPSITADCFAVLALACAALALWMIRLRRSSHATLSGCILLSISLLIASAVPILSIVPWATFAEEASDQVLAAVHLLQVAYIILTL